MIAFVEAAESWPRRVLSGFSGECYHWSPSSSLKKRHPGNPKRKRGTDSRGNRDFQSLAHASGYLFQAPLKKAIACPISASGHAIRH